MAAIAAQPLSFPGTDRWRICGRMGPQQRRGPLREARHGHASRLRKAASVQLDPLDLVQGLGGQVALTTLGANHHRYVLNDQEVRALAVAPGHEADLSLALTTDVADHRLLFHVNR